MISEAPPFWWQTPGWQARLLSPLAFVYGKIAGARMDRAGRESVPVPVLCIGNFTVGGAGKTPTALALGQAAKDLGRVPGFLSRGYGGRLKRATVVDPARHTARDVGDEPLLLAGQGLTVVAAKRLDGARLLIEQGADIILMDDGFQSAHLTFDLALLVVDAGRGIGNGHVLPAGPLRAPLDRQMRHAGAILKIGQGERADPLVRLAARAGKPIHAASIAVTGDLALRGKRVFAFSGIADPEKFFRTVKATGTELAGTRTFPDHHPFSRTEMAALVAEAERLGCPLVTTTKDRIRIDGSSTEGQALLDRTQAVPVTLRFDDPAAPRQILRATIAARMRRM